MTEMETATEAVKAALAKADGVRKRSFKAMHEGGMDLTGFSDPNNQRLWDEVVAEAKTAHERPPSP